MYLMLPYRNIEDINRKLSTVRSTTLLHDSQNALQGGFNRTAPQTSPSIHWVTLKQHEAMLFIHKSVIIKSKLHFSSRLCPDFMKISNRVLANLGKYYLCQTALVGGNAGPYCLVSELLLISGVVPLWRSIHYRNFYGQTQGLAWSVPLSYK